MTTEPKSNANFISDRAGDGSALKAKSTQIVHRADQTASGPASRALVQRESRDVTAGSRSGADRMRAIADLLHVPVRSFFGKTVDATVDAPAVLNLLDHPENVRLVRAFAKISDPIVRHHLLSTVEAAAMSEPLSGPRIGIVDDDSTEGQG